jgi:hypothetical protein
MGGGLGAGVGAEGVISLESAARFSSKNKGDIRSSFCLVFEWQ